MLRPVLFILAAAALAGCGTGTGSLIDFGPEPGTEGDPAYWHFQPQLHGPEAIARAERQQAENQAAAPTSAPSAAPAEPAAIAPPALPPPPAETTPAPGPISETMFNDAIRRAVSVGDIDRALRLLEEAERLGSKSARPAFIEALEGRGGR